MIKHMLTSALFAGFAAALLAALLHFAFVQKYILLGEQYESGELTYFHDTTQTESLGHGAMADTGQPQDNADGHAHNHDAAETSTLSRNTLTVLFEVLVYVAYGLIMVAGFGLAEAYGAKITAREGLLWGIAGFVSFQLAPAIGLAPELPGTIAADLTQRQIWWWGTALSTGTGLALLAYGRGYLVWALAVLALAVPHLIGAPLPEGFSGVTPPEVSAMFAARTLGVGLAVWSVLGWLAGHFWSQQDPA